MKILKFLKFCLGFFLKQEKFDNGALGVDDVVIFQI